MAFALGVWGASSQTSTTSTSKKKKTKAKATSTAKATAKRPVASKSKKPPVVVHRTPQQPSADRYKEIQQALADKGYFHGDSDGNWGPASVDALKRFQHDQNLVEDGKIGSLSLIALGLGPKREPVAQLDQKAPTACSIGFSRCSAH